MKVYTHGPYKKLTVGKEYNIHNDSFYKHDYLIINDCGDLCKYHRAFFKSRSEIRDETLKEILQD